MVHAQFTKEQLDEMVAISLEKYRLREGYEEKDVTWNDLKGRIKDRLQKSFNGEEIPQNLNNKDKGLSDYVKDNFGQDKGYGLKKFGRQINRGAQVGTALATMATAAPVAKIAGKATRAAQAVPGAAKGILKRFIGESAELNFEVPKEYTHFAIRKSDGKIVNGWDYSEFDPEDLRRFPKDYFIDDLIDMEVNPKLFKIATVRACKGMGIDPFDCKNWDNLAEGDWMEESCDRKKKVNEGGHLYHKDPETGEVWTNSKEKWRGVPGTTYIWHGEWSDPEVIYNGHEYNVNDIEDFMWEQYKEYCTMSPEDCTDEIDKKYAGTKPTDESYEEFLKDMGISWVQSTLDEFDVCIHCDESKNRKKQNE